MPLLATRPRQENFVAVGFGRQLVYRNPVNRDNMLDDYVMIYSAQADASGAQVLTNNARLAGDTRARDGYAVRSDPYTVGGINPGALGLLNNGLANESVQYARLPCVETESFTYVVSWLPLVGASSSDYLCFTKETDGIRGQLCRRVSTSYRFDFAFDNAGTPEFWSDDPERVDNSGIQAPDNSWQMVAVSFLSAGASSRFRVTNLLTGDRFQVAVPGNYIPSPSDTFVGNSRSLVASLSAQMVVRRYVRFDAELSDADLALWAQEIASFTNVTCNVNLVPASTYTVD